MNWFFWRKKQKTIVDEVADYVKELFSENPEMLSLIGTPLVFWIVNKITEENSDV